MGRKTPFERIAVREARRRLRLEVLAAYGARCACCGEVEEAFLSLDHIYEDGAEHRRRVGIGSWGVYADVKRQGFPRDRYQVLCHNCNKAKHHRGVCPHQQAFAPNVRHVRAERRQAFAGVTPYVVGSPRTWPAEQRTLGLDARPADASPAEREEQMT